MLPLIKIMHQTYLSYAELFVFRAAESKKASNQEVTVRDICEQVVTNSHKFRLLQF